MGRLKSRFYKDAPARRRDGAGSPAGGEAAMDTNMAMIVDAAGAAAPSERTTGPAPLAGGRRRRREEGEGKGERLMSKKKVQFQAYLAKKIKKDNRPQLMARLAKSSFATPGILASTKNITVPSDRLQRTRPAISVCREEAPLPEDEEGSPLPSDDASSSSDDASSSSDEESSSLHGITNPAGTTSTAGAYSHEVAFLKRSSLNPLDDSSADEDRRSADDDAGASLQGELVCAPAVDGAMRDICASYSAVGPGISFVTIERPAEVEAQREKLPIYREEQAIMETIMANAVTVICGETGSGKTTQVPQFLYEAAFAQEHGHNPGMVGVTQPRRVAAISMAERVAFELGRPAEVAYQIRNDATVTRGTRIKFMTDGILLREIGEDFMLTKYSVVILDEAHERNLNTDILIGMLSRILRVRNKMAHDYALWSRRAAPTNGGEGVAAEAAEEQPPKVYPLRLVIMSATLNVEELTSARLFQPTPPVLRVEARQHPVTIHFSRRTESDHVESAFKMIRKIHASLPPGGILVFMTGRHEIISLARRLRAKYAWMESARDGEDGEDGESEDGEDDEGVSWPSHSEGEDEQTSEGEDEQTSDGEGGQQSMHASETREPLHVLPLYSLLAPEEQRKVFLEPPMGSRLCVLSTNVAETSLTIPNIRYVVDCGLVKERHYDGGSGSYRFDITWTSKASAAQRAGRAGRTGPGHCYRLYSSPVFDQSFQPFPRQRLSARPLRASSCS